MDKSLNHQVCESSLSLSATARLGWDTVTGLVTYYPEWRTLLAIPSGRKTGSTLNFLLQRVQDEDRRILQDLCAAIGAGRTNSMDIAVRVRRFDNTWSWLLLRGKLDPARPGMFAGVAVEVSRLRLDKRFLPPSLDEAKTSYQSLLEHSPNNIVRFDRELFPLYMNPAVVDFVPFPPEELGARKAAEAGADISDIEFVQNNVEQVFASGEVIKARRTMGSSRGTLVFEFTFWPEFDSNGTAKSVLSLQQDLTAQARREEEANANEKRFAALYQLTQMNDAPEEDVIRFVVEKVAELTASEFSHLYIPPRNPGLRGHITWSESHLKLLSEEELTGPDAQLIGGEFGCTLGMSGPSEPKMQNHPVASSSGVFFHGKLPISRFMTASALEGGKVMCLAAVYNKNCDYTQADMRQLQTFINGAWLILRRRWDIDDLKKAKECAERANKVKDRFLANVSHELRTPLNGLLSMLQLLEMSPLAADQQEYAKCASSTGQILLRIISDILDFSKMASGRLELDPKPFDLMQTLEDTVGLFVRDARNKGLDLILTRTGGFSALVNGDEGRVRQIIFNLVGNALKFTEQGQIEVSCEVRAVRPDTVSACLTVRDTGIGIPPDMLAKVFDAFTQVDGSSTRRHQGSGLGLGIVRELTKLMSGTVSLSSYPGRGTVVECMLPFQVVPENPAGKDAAAAESKGAVSENCPVLNVLVAEDDTVSRTAMKLFLERLGHRVVCVTNGREALEALRLHAFDCFISDVLMPEMDGIEATRHIRSGMADAPEPSDAVREMVLEGMGRTGEAAAAAGGPLPIPRNIPIVAVSAHAMKGDKEHFLAEGMDYYLSKPVRLKDLDAMLKRVHRYGREAVWDAVGR